MGFGQFSPHILSFEEQATAVLACERIGILQQLGQGGQGPGCHHIESLRRRIFQAGIPDRDRHAHTIGRSLKEGALLGGGLMQVDR
jgi:hypothetical protein